MLFAARKSFTMSASVPLRSIGRKIACKSAIAAVQATDRMMAYVFAVASESKNNTTATPSVVDFNFDRLTPATTASFHFSASFVANDNSPRILSLLSAKYA